MKPFSLVSLSVAILATFALPAIAQPVISAKSGLLSYVEGQVKLDNQPVEFSNTRFADVKENSTVSTQDGRAEVLLTPGVTLRLGENSSLRMITNRLVDTRLELLSGSAVVEADLIAKDTSVTVVVGPGATSLPKAGLYRFDVSPAQVRVFKGEAEVEVAGQTKVVSSSRMLSLATESASIEKFDTEDTDALDRWSHRRGSYLAMANTSAARSLVSSGGIPSTWGMSGCAPAWGYNSYYSMMTFMPCTGSLWSPYGYQFWSPYSIGRAYWVNAPLIYGGGASRTTSSSTGSASLARPVTTAGYRSTEAAPGLASSHVGSIGNTGSLGRMGASSMGASNMGSGNMGSSAGSSAGGGARSSGGGASGGFGGGGAVGAHR
jgi:hypothetical protein